MKPSILGKRIRFSFGVNHSKKKSEDLKRKKKTKAEKRRIRKKYEMMREESSDSNHEKVYKPRVMVYNLPSWSG